jgi:hypothetical protein
MDVIDLTESPKEVAIYPDLLKLARNYNLCAVVEIKQGLSVETLIDEITSSTLLEDVQFQYCGAADQRHFFALNTCYKGKYCRQSASIVLDSLGARITYELVSLKMLKRKKK